MKPSIPIIAIDGMHRSGKNTQLTLLETQLQKQGWHPFIVRGEYYRPGIGGEDDLLDPLSHRWQHHKLSTNYDEKSTRLQRELYHFFAKKLPRFCAENNIVRPIALFDRSVVGRYLFKAGEGDIREENATHTRQTTLKTYSYGKGAQHIRDVIIPDIIFVLQPSKQALMERLYISHAPGYTNTSDEYKKRNAYKQSYIPQKYDTYYAGMKFLPDILQQRIHHITSDASSDIIHTQIRETTQEKLQQQEIGTKQEYNDTKLSMQKQSRVA